MGHRETQQQQGLSVHLVAESGKQGSSKVLTESVTLYICFHVTYDTLAL